MTTLLATIRKELLELRRDRAGILVLLVMPMALVLIVSLVQDNVMQATGETPIRVLLVDLDNGFLGRAVESQLRLDGGLELIRKPGDRGIGEETARKAVVDGEFRYICAPALIDLRKAALFKDAQGFSTGDETPWQTLILSEYATEAVRFTAMNNQAKKYTVRVRQAR